MRKATFRGYVPEGYGDSGYFVDSVWIMDGSLDAEKVCRHSAFMSTDAKFVAMVSVEETDERPPFLAMVYKGMKTKWSSYFKDYLTEYDVGCMGYDGKVR